MSDAKQYTFKEVETMTFAQLGEITDPMQLAATGHVSPILVRYLIKTDQLDARYPNVPLRALLGIIDLAAASLREWPSNVSQKAPLAIRDADVDAYFDAIAID